MLSERVNTPAEATAAVASDDTATGQDRGKRVWLWPSVAIIAAVTAGASVYWAQRSSSLDDARAAYSQAVTLNEQARTKLNHAADGVGFTVQECEADGGAPADCQALSQVVETARAGLAQPLNPASAKDLDAVSARSRAEALRAAATDFEAQATQIKTMTEKLDAQFQDAVTTYLNGEGAALAESCEAAKDSARGIENLAGEADALAGDCENLTASGKSARLSALKEKAVALQSRVEALNGKVAAAQAPAPSAPIAASGGSESTGSDSGSDYESLAPAAPAPAPAPGPGPGPTNDDGVWVDSGWVLDNEKWCSWADEYGNSKLIPCP
ncbi:hypothetical protein ACFMOM_03670 [Schaalia turicensis]